MLRNRTELEQKQLFGVNRAAADFKLQPGWFRTLENWVPGKRFNLKKKRGVGSVASGPEFALEPICGDGPGPSLTCDVDLITWDVTQLNSEHIMVDMAWSPSLTLGVMIAIDDSNNHPDPGKGFIYHSTDMATWTLEATVVFPNSANNAKLIIWSPELAIFVMFADGFNTVTGVVYTSSDGLTWNQGTIASQPANAFNGIAWSPDLNLFAVTGGSITGTQQIATSPDGVTWTYQTTPTTSPALHLFNVAWSPTLGLFAATGFEFDSSPSASPNQCVVTSPDGINWTRRTTPDWSDIRHIIWSTQFEKFLAINLHDESGTNSDYDTFLYSADGTTWTEATIPAETITNDIVWYPQQKIVEIPSCNICLTLAFDDATNETVVIFTEDGITWELSPTVVSSEQLWQKLIYVPELQTLAAHYDRSFDGLGSELLHDILTGQL